LSHLWNNSWTRHPWGRHRATHHLSHLWNRYPWGRQRATHHLSHLWNRYPGQPQSIKARPRGPACPRWWGTTALRGARGQAVHSISARTLLAPMGTSRRTRRSAPTGRTRAWRPCRAHVRLDASRRSETRASKSTATAARGIGSDLVLYTPQPPFTHQALLVLPLRCIKGVPGFWVRFPITSFTPHSHPSRLRATRVTSEVYLGYEGVQHRVSVLPAFGSGSLPLFSRALRTLWDASHRSTRSETPALSSSAVSSSSC